MQSWKGFCKIQKCDLFMRLKLLQSKIYCRVNSTITSSTIYALSSGKGKCGVAVIRISGPHSSSVLEKMAGLKTVPEPRRALLRHIKHPDNHEILDQGLILWFPGPNSFTGEDSCEFQVHGGTAVVSAVLRALAAIPGLRPAQPGEFTKRAFYSNKMDLTKAEGLADLIHAETEAQRRQALLQARGSLYQRYNDWREQLKRKREALGGRPYRPPLRPALLQACLGLWYCSSLKRRWKRPQHCRTCSYTTWCSHRCLSRSPRWWTITLQCIAHVEAYIDFSEDQNIEDDILLTTNNELKTLKLQIQAHLQDGRRGERTRDGVKTVIVGAPNVGKSSLLNALCQRPAAIVSSQPGTTRDVVCATLDIAGFPVVLSDTAGLRDKTDDLIEREGINRAHQELAEADLLLVVIDATYYQTWSESNPGRTFLNFMEIYLEQLKLKDSVLSCGNIKKLLNNDTPQSEINNVCILVFNKLDLIQDKSLICKICDEYPTCVTAISCKNDGNSEPLLDKLNVWLEELCGEPSRENACLSQARHRYHLTACVAALDRYLAMCGSEREIDQAAHQLRVAVSAIGYITGHVSTEQILDVIFKDFCIGK